MVNILKTILKIKFFLLNYFKKINIINEKMINSYAGAYASTNYINGLKHF